MGTEQKQGCTGDYNCDSLTHGSDCVSRYHNTEFGKWWATKQAEGYQYGYEALENVRFGFEAGFALAKKRKAIEP